MIEPPLPTNMILPPLPTNIVLERLRPLLSALQAAATHAPRDARIVSAVTHLSATIAALELPPAEPAAEPDAQTPLP